MRGTRLGLVLVATALVVTSCSSGSGKGAAVASANVQVDKTDNVLPLSRAQEGAAVLVDKDDPKTVYLANSEMTTGQCKFYVSTNQGLTWREENAPKLDPFTQNCAMGYASSQNLRTELKQSPDGTIYDVFQANAPNANGSRSVLVGRTKDGGRSWETVPVVVGTPGPEPGVNMEVNFEGHIAIDPANPKRIYAMWRRSFNKWTPSKPTRPYMSTSEDGGATWSPAQLMFEKNNGFDGPRPVIVGNQLFAFYRESAPPAPTGGAAPSPTPPVTKLFAAVSTDGGKTWADHQISEANDASEPVPLYDRDRKVFNVVWHDNRSGDLDVYYASSKDGVTWTQPKRLNDDPPGTRVGQHYPQMSISPNGRLDVAWYDWRDDQFPPPTTEAPGSPLELFSDRGVQASVYLTSSRDGGATWTKNTRVNDTLIDRSIGTWENNIDVLAPVAVASFDSGAVVAFSDTRNGNAVTQTQDIYTSTVAFGKAKVRKVTGLQAGIVGLLLGLGIAMCLAVLIVRRQGGPPAPAPVTREPALQT